MQTPRKKLTLEEAAILIDGGCPEGFALEATSDGETIGLAHAWNDSTDGSLCGAVVSGAVPGGSQIRPWDDKVDCPGCLSLMSAANRMSLSEQVFQGCRESDRIAEGLDAMGKPAQDDESPIGAMTEEEKQEYRLDQQDEAEKEIVNPFDTMDWGDGKAKPLETIDITPVGCQTPEGCKRIEDAQREWDSATHELANTLKRVIEEIFDRDTDKIARAEYYSELQTLIGVREVKQEAFLRAVAGR